MQPAASRRFPYSHSKTAFNALLRSKLNLRWKSSVAAAAASVPPEEFESVKQQNYRKRIPKHKRRAMVEIFVDRYMASNGGKFPTAVHTFQQLGGDYYVVREIIQELQFKRKQSLMEAGDVRLGRVEKIITPMEGPSLSEEKLPDSSVECTHKQSDMGVTGAVDMSGDLLAKEETHISADTGRVSVREVVIDNALDGAENALDVAECTSQTDVEMQKKNVASSLADKKWRYSDRDFSVDKAITSVENSKVEEDAPPSEIQGSERYIDSTICLQDAEGPKGDELQRNHGEVSKSEKVTDDDRRMSEESPSSPKGSNIWGNLKSLADGIFSFWKKR